METTDGDDQWGRQTQKRPSPKVPGTNGDNQWRQPMGTTDGDVQWGRTNSDKKIAKIAFLLYNIT
jgi:hypothetical protein